MKVKLLQPHTHAGVLFHPQHVLDVDESDANWLITNKIAEAVTEKSVASSAPAKPLAEPK